MVVHRGLPDVVREGVRVTLSEALLETDVLAEGDPEALAVSVGVLEVVALRVAVHARLALGVCDTDAVADAEPALDSVRLAVALPDGAVAVGLREVVNDEPDRVAVAVAVCVPDRVPWQVALGVGVAVMRDDGDGEGDGVSESDAVLEAEALGVGETVEDRDGVRDVGVREGVGDCVRLPEGEALADEVTLSVRVCVRDRDDWPLQLRVRVAGLGVVLRLVPLTEAVGERPGLRDAGLGD